MTQSGVSNAIVDAMLSWLKGLASWVLKLFNLSGGFSPLRFLANNWLKLLIFFLIVGVAMDLLIWLIRWRPHWVWFHKKRVIINDKNFFDRDPDAGADRWQVAPAGGPVRPKRNWEENQYVVPGAARRRREEQAREAERRKARAARVKSMQMSAEPAEEPTDVFTDGMFNVNAKQKFSDKYEDEVFSVSNLPKPGSDNAAAQPALTGGAAPRTHAKKRPASGARNAKPTGAKRAGNAKSSSRPKRAASSGAKGATMARGEKRASGVRRPASAAKKR